ncbi:HTH-type transcriptional repressor YvoA [compost metagenome]
MVLSVKPPPMTARSVPHSGAGVTQYLQLASILRHQIAHGELVSGQRLPTVLQLAGQYKVAGITVRQAYGLLKTEGLITSDRGRGTYVSAPAASMTANMHAAINDPRASDVRFEVLEQRYGVNLPEPLSRGAAADSSYKSYTFIRKIHVQDGEPFCMAEIYVASEIYQRFPEGAEQQHKIAYLLNEYSKSRMLKMQQTLTVAPADMVLAQALGCSFATPMAHMVRRISDASGHIAYAGLFWYRGDRFVLESEYPFELWLSYPGVAVPQTLG